MLKKSASGVPRLAEAAWRGRSHRSEAQRTEAYCLASSLAAALLDSLFEHPEVILMFAPNRNFRPYF